MVAPSAAGQVVCWTEAHPSTVARLGLLERKGESMSNASLPLVHRSGHVLTRFREPNMQLLAMLVIWDVLWLRNFLILHNRG
jgi:hypothetical protein